MSDLGQLLKKARTQKGITLDELQELTKIRKRYLEAIEDGNYKVLPGNFYVRAFIKSYSEAVGLEPDEVLKLYQNDIPVVHVEPVKEPVVRRRTKSPRNTERLSRWTSAFLVVAFPLLIIGVIYYFYLDRNDNSGNSVNDPLPITETKADDPDNQNTANEQLQPDPEPEPTPEPPKPEIALVKSEDGVDYYTLSNSTQVKVVVEVTGDQCWMAIRKDNVSGEFVDQNLTLRNGDIREWTFDGGAYFHFGRQNAIKVKINDQEINLGDKANPRKIQIDLAAATTLAL